MMHRLLKNKAINFSRHIVVNHLSGIIPFCLTIEYPKSGETWFRQLISDYLNIPFPRNQFPKLTKSMLHGHYPPAKRMSDIKRIFYVVRDGRDGVIVKCCVWH